jgi:hypothetical protein
MTSFLLEKGGRIGKETMNETTHAFNMMGMLKGKME